MGKLRKANFKLMLLMRVNLKLPKKTKNIKMNQFKKVFSRWHKSSKLIAKVKMKPWANISTRKQHQFSKKSQEQQESKRTKQMISEQL